jgi:pimeloyl-ACP methyl ester carboxylesterase
LYYEGGAAAVGLCYGSFDDIKKPVFLPKKFKIMKKLSFILVFAFAVLFSNAQNSLSGYWIDTVSFGVVQLRLVLHFYEKDTLLAMDYYSIDQNKQAISLKDWTRNGDSIFAKDKISKVDFLLRYDSLNQRISGVLKQRGAEFPLRFKPIDKLPVTLRPQTPKAPFPYKIKEVSIPNKKTKIALSGTLTLPEKGENLKAIVLLPGSGPHDRDETIFEHKLLWVLADSLTRQGYAVLRYDKRGIKKSEGDYSKATIYDFYEDACAAIEFLRKDNRIDKNGIGIIGHSEGGIIAPMVAAKDKKIAFIVSLAGSVQRGRDLMLAQCRLLLQSEGIGEDSIAVDQQIRAFIYDEILKNGNTKEFANKLSETLDNYVLNLSDREKEILSWNSVSKANFVIAHTLPYMKYFIALQPEAYINKVKCPVLAIFGEKDIQVPAIENAGLMRKCLQKANNEHHSKVVVIEGANHLLQKCNTCKISEYGQIEETIAPEVLKLLFNWINEKP